jgi:recombination protein U
MAKDYSRANRGKAFESLIESANNQYFITNVAAIEKQEIQTKFIRGQYIYSKKGPPDFMGVLAGGQGIAFDAKTTAATSFPLKNITDRPHQLEFLQQYNKLGGLGFYLIEFSKERRYFLLTIPELLKFIKRAEDGGRKSIHLLEFKTEVKSSFHNALDYLKPINGGSGNG